MPMQQISVVPAMKENTSNGWGSSRTRDKSKENEIEKAPGRSGSRSSNISKASSSTQGLTLNDACRTSVTLSNQDICSKRQVNGFIASRKTMVGEVG
ncbi:hypothetical protein P4O66_012504 [Electrophorus voltai]|uniref:Uncharacterized protein n=1 Tax=Electrophorus voltai TaxID=2609070 RepID=A0AAD9DUW4_9TELE|nr:hypothetical protein P4O66_012504 [Electrophorus voltai]